MLDAESKAVLTRILNTDPGQLSETDIEFLKARRGYLTSEQKRIFSPVLGELANEPALPQPQQVIEQTPAVQPAPQAPQVDNSTAGTGVDPYDPDATTPAQG